MNIYNWKPVKWTIKFHKLVTSSFDQAAEEEGDASISLEPESVLQPIMDAVKFGTTWQMGLLYGAIIFTGMCVIFAASLI